MNFMMIDRWKITERRKKKIKKKIHIIKTVR